MEGKANGIGSLTQGCQDCNDHHDGQLARGWYASIRYHSAFAAKTSDFFRRAQCSQVNRFALLSHKMVDRTAVDCYTVSVGFILANQVRSKVAVSGKGALKRGLGMFMINWQAVANHGDETSLLSGGGRQDD